MLAAAFTSTSPTTVRSSVTLLTPTRKLKKRREMKSLHQEIGHIKYIKNLLASPVIPSFNSTALEYTDMNLVNGEYRGHESLAIWTYQERCEDTRLVIRIKKGGGLHLNAYSKTGNRLYHYVSTLTLFSQAEFLFRVADG
ncbi:hypothetical protein ACJJTC_017396 [Scirpophaga incertulas]